MLLRAINNRRPRTSLQRRQTARELLFNEWLTESKERAAQVPKQRDPVPSYFEHAEHSTSSK